jgi:hypothetical protein
MLALTIGLIALAAVIWFALDRAEQLPEERYTPDSDWRNAIPERWRTR